MVKANYESFYSDVGKTWDLQRIYQDLAAKKGTELTSFEKVCLRGFIQGDEPKTIAKKVSWEPNSFRVDISRRVYTYLGDLLNKEQIRWEKIAIWLEEKGYKLNSLVESKLSTISQIPEIQAQMIISSIESKFVKSLLALSPREKSLCLSEEELEKKEKQGDLAYKNANYLEAINIYSSILQEDPLSFCGCFLKIAECFERLQAFKDSVEICYFSLNYIRNAEGRSNAYTFIGSAFHELCLHSGKIDDLEQCLLFYRQALDYAEHNLPSAWNILDALVNFHTLNGQTGAVYFNKEIIAFHDFKTRVGGLTSKLAILESIQEDAKRLVQRIKDNNFRNEIKAFFNL